MRILALETSTLLGSVAIVENGNLISSEASHRQKSHSEVINVFVEQVLNRANLKIDDIDMFAVGEGPGSFTGIRVASNIGKTFSFMTGKPIFSLNSLYNLAIQHKKKDLPIFSMINAYKNMVYYSLVKFDEDKMVILIEPNAISVRDLNLVIKEKCYVVGDGFSTFEAYLPNETKNLLIREEDPSDFPTAATLAQSFFSQRNLSPILKWNEVLPLYIRSSEAEENKKGIIFKPF